MRLHDRRWMARASDHRAGVLQVRLRGCGRGGVVTYRCLICPGRFSESEDARAHHYTDTQGERNGSESCNETRHLG